MVIKMPEQVIRIIRTFELNGFEAYAVGGCVRDSILGKDPYDWDITTDALPEQTIKIFDSYKIVKTGLKHGTVTIVINHRPFEVTTFRIDGKYSDNRRPDKVEFTRNIKEDLSRRDFTINAMAYNPKKGIVDFFGGRNDIKNRIINCVGKPDMRFNEDALRIMRALRFASVLGFEIEANTVKSIHRHRQLLHNIAVERIAIELNKLLIGENVKSILELFSDVIVEFIPEIRKTIGFEQYNSYHHLDVWHHTIEAISMCPDEIVYRLTMLFHDIAKPICFTQDDNGIGHFKTHPVKSSEIASNVLKRLKYDNYTIGRVKDLVLHHDDNILVKKKNIKRFLNKMGEDTFRQLIQIKRADIKAQNPELLYRLSDLDNVEIMLNEIIEQQQCFCLKDLKIDGKDLIGLGIPKGKQIGTILNKLVDMVIDEQIENDRDKLLKQALSLIE